MKIYTKAGDQGKTTLFLGGKVDKDSLRVAAYGAIDELNSHLGLATSANLPLNIKKKLERVQRELFVLGGDLATPKEIKVKIPRLTYSYVLRLEKEIDAWEKDLPKIKNFILPGGSENGARLHLARTVARRSERIIVALSKMEKINGRVLPYINRLSDWLFVAARSVNKSENSKETIWKGRG